MFNETPFSLNPIQFFSLSADCYPLSKNKEEPSFTRHLLPSTDSLTHEKVFAEVAIGWSEEGIGVAVRSHAPATSSNYPLIEEGDCVELFFDTRDLKSTGFNTRFCHHFFFLPQPVEGISKGEKTHFRTEDSHPLCDGQWMSCRTDLHKSGYLMKIFIPSQCLCGYDPRQFDRIGFTYRIRQAGGGTQHFSVVSQDYQVEQQPSLWASLLLKKESLTDDENGTL